jgi:hypothetical protein
MAAIGKQAAKQRFMEFLGQKNLRLTSQRQAIIDTVFGTEEHFTAEQLLDWSRRRDKSVSRATVYRTLPLLTESVPSSCRTGPSPSSLRVYRSGKNVERTVAGRREVTEGSGGTYEVVPVNASPSGRSDV